MSTRLNSLLEMAAEKFADMSNPFDASVLAEHRVTLDECGDLSEQIAFIIRGYLALPAEDQMRLMLAYALRDEPNKEGLLNAAKRSQAMSDALKRLKEI